MHSAIGNKYLMRIGCFFLMLLGVAGEAYGQTVVKRNFVYLELEKRKPFYSFNYERIFYAGAKMMYSYRGGLSVGHRSFYAPVGISAIKGRKAHHLAFDLTLAPYNVKYTKAERGSTNVWDTYLYVLPAVGYRFHGLKKGWFFKISASPGIMLDVPSKHYLEVKPEYEPSVFLGFGYSF